jgi:hypothetical protein
MYLPFPASSSGADDRSKAMTPLSNSNMDQNQNNNHNNNNNNVYRQNRQISSNQPSFQCLSMMEEV